MSSARPAVLTYHSLDESGSVISVAPALFREQMRILADSGVRVVPLEQLPATPGAVALTFDDAFGSVYRYALPVLERYGMPATAFAVSGWCGKQNDWPSQPGGIPRMGLMDWSELKEAAVAGMTIGAHSVTHPRLPSLSQREAERELADSRAEIEDRLGAPVTLFAYPYGESNAAIRAAAQREFRIACGTRLDFTGPQDDPWDLPRIDVFYLRTPWLFRRLLTGVGAAYVAARGLLRGIRERVA